MTNELLQPIDLSPLTDVMAGLASVFDAALEHARYQCRMNEQHYPISSKAPCPHYVPSDQLYLIGDFELATWINLRIKERRINTAVKGFDELVKRGRAMQEKLPAPHSKEEKALRDKWESIMRLANESLEIARNQIKRPR